MENAMIVVPILLSQAEQYASYKTNYGLIFIQWILLLIPVAFFYILFAVCIWRVAKYFGNAMKEQKLLRIEMGKLVEEVHLLRQEMNGDKKRVTSMESG